MPLALFDPNLTDEDKNKLANTLISTRRPTEFAVGKPKHPTINWRPDDQPNHSDLIGERSFLIIIESFIYFLFTYKFTLR